MSSGDDYKITQDVWFNYRTRHIFLPGRYGSQLSMSVAGRFLPGHVLFRLLGYLNEADVEHPAKRIISMFTTDHYPMHVAGL